MFKNITIRQQLLVVPVVITIAFIYLYYAIDSNLDKLEEKSVNASVADTIVQRMLEARVNEKEYILQADSNHSAALYKLIGDSVQMAKDLQRRFKDPQNRRLVKNVITNIEEYLKLFTEFQNTTDAALAEQTKMVKEAGDVESIALKVRKIQSAQRDRVIRSSKDANKIADEVQEASLADKMLKELLLMRIAEKNYLNYNEKRYRDEVAAHMNNIVELSSKLKSVLDSAKNRMMVDAIVGALKEYKKAFQTFSEYQNESAAILKQMSKEAQEAQEALHKLQLDQQKEKEQLARSLQTQLIILFVTIGLGMLVFMLVVSTIIGRNLRRITNAANNLASGDGDLTKRIDIDGKNELATVAYHTNRFIEKVQDAITEAKNVSSEASSISHELSATSLEIGKRVEDEARLAESINNDTAQMTQEAEFVERAVNDMSAISQRSVEALGQTTQKINNLIATVKDSSVKEEELALKMQELKESTNDVKSILELIGDIAEQTNLLSLNAAIEAARAGEHGRGFAVVADEVRKLAERTQKSLTEINATINVVVQAVDEASDNMQVNAAEIAQAAEQVSGVEQSIDSVRDAIEKSRSMAEESAAAVDKLKSRVVAISSKMAQLNEVSGTNARSVEEIAAAAEHQNDMIEKLNSQLNNFTS
ncbi:methyl-accepting chemotaxis protein [Hydrogenimonas sp.]